jgi:putative acetyltransferase
LDKIIIDRLILRKIVKSDLQDVYDYSKNPIVGLSAGWKPHESIEETEKIMNEVFLDKDYIWGIELVENSKIIGSIGLLEDPKRQNSRARMIGYAIGVDYWGKGIMTQAAKAVVDYGFANMDLNLISAYCYPSNHRSQNVLKKIGFEYEGTLRQAEKIFNGEVLDHMCFILQK